MTSGNWDSIVQGFEVQIRDASRGNSRYEKNILLWKSNYCGAQREVSHLFKTGSEIT